MSEATSATAGENSLRAGFEALLVGVNIVRSERRAHTARVSQWRRQRQRKALLKALTGWALVAKLSRKMEGLVALCLRREAVTTRNINFFGWKERTRVKKLSKEHKLRKRRVMDEQRQTSSEVHSNPARVTGSWSHAEQQQSFRQHRQAEQTVSAGAFANGAHRAEGERRVLEQSTAHRSFSSPPPSTASLSGGGYGSGVITMSTNKRRLKTIASSLASPSSAASPAVTTAKPCLVAADSSARGLELTRGDPLPWRQNSEAKSKRSRRADEDRADANGLSPVSRRRSDRYPSDGEQRAERKGLVVAFDFGKHENEVQLAETVREQRNSGDTGHSAFAAQRYRASNTAAVLSSPSSLSREQRGREIADSSGEEGEKGRLRDSSPSLEDGEGGLRRRVEDRHALERQPQWGSHSTSRYRPSLATPSSAHVRHSVELPRGGTRAYSDRSPFALTEKRSANVEVLGTGRRQTPKRTEDADSLEPFLLEFDKISRFSTRKGKF